LILLASSAYYIRNISNNNFILEKIFSFLIRSIICGTHDDKNKIMVFNNNDTKNIFDIKLENNDSNSNQL